MYPHLVARSDMYPHTVARSDMYPHTVARSEMYAHTVARSDMYPHPVARSDMYPHPVARSDMYPHPVALFGAMVGCYLMHSQDHVEDTRIRYKLTTPRCVQTSHSSLYPDYPLLAVSRLATPRCIQTSHSSLLATPRCIQTRHSSLYSTLHLVCPSQLQNFRLLLAQKITRDLGTSVHVIGPVDDLKLTGKDNKLVKQIVGFDGNSVFVLADAKKKGGEGNSELRKVLTHKPDPCLQYPQNTYGTTFVSQNFLEARASGRKQFLQVVSHRLADALSTELYEDCVCFLRDGVHAETRCRVSGRKERERLEVGFESEIICGFTRPPQNRNVITQRAQDNHKVSALSARAVSLMFNSSLLCPLCLRCSARENQSNLRTSHLNSVRMRRKIRSEQTASLSVGVFISVKRVFISVKGVFIPVKGVFISVKGVFISVKVVFISVKRVFISVKRVFISVKGVFISVKGVFIPVKGVFISVKGVFWNLMRVFTLRLRRFSSTVAVLTR
uniref:Uncharacterized protein n=1 Tax=Timema shepardi TaxID=629360 RepID=A0A7R9AR93_TIMSH|nr:unnamed protein product [Timema shepardi]